MGTTLLGYSMQEFLKITPRLLLKQYIKHLEFTQPDALKKEKQLYTLDQTPFI